jgi:hypothetical protein
MNIKYQLNKKVKYLFKLNDLLGKNKTIEQ